MNYDGFVMAMVWSNVYRRSKDDSSGCLNVGGHNTIWGEKQEQQEQEDFLSNKDLLRLKIIQ